MVRKALFAGLCTLDVAHLVDAVPGPDEKTVSRRQAVAAGGPAANAAAAFAHLGGTATLLTGVGTHPLAAGITADLAAAGVGLVDLAAASDEPPPLSSILVTAATGERSVVSRNARGRSLAPPPDLREHIERVDAIEVDGHHMEVALEAATVARGLGRLTVFDGGSWKPGTEELLPRVDVAVCSADFRPPGTSSADQVLDALLSAGASWAAVSAGAAPIRWAGGARSGQVAVPAVRVVDTLGAGDVLHGALTRFLPRRGRLTGQEVERALARAAAVAARACTGFGTRSWMRAPAPDRARDGV